MQESGTLAFYHHKQFSLKISHFESVCSVDLGFEHFYFFYYHENRCEVGHFQSIRPNQDFRNQMNEIADIIKDIAAPIY